jgi:hypothetical protein
MWEDASGAYEGYELQGIVRIARGQVFNERAGVLLTYLLKSLPSFSSSLPGI